MRGGERREEEGQKEEVLGSSWQAHQAGICGLACRYCREALGLAPVRKEPYGDH